MKLKEALESYYEYSRKTSDIARYLGLAGLGIIWIFRIQTTNKLALPRELILPTSLLILGLVLDLLQYIVGTIIWGAYHRLKEKMGVKENEEIRAPRQLNWPTLTFFWAKLFPILIAYYLILSYLYAIFVC